MTDKVQIPKAPDNRMTPGHWNYVTVNCDSGDVPGITVGCSECGNASSLIPPGWLPPEQRENSHVVDRAGVVSPSIVCPHEGCSWHVWGTLLEFEARGPLP